MGCRVGVEVGLAVGVGVAVAVCVGIGELVGAGVIFTSGELSGVRRAGGEVGCFTVRRAGAGKSTGVTGMQAVRSTKRISARNHLEKCELFVFITNYQ